MIFVTGGTGLLGNCIVRELCARQMPVRVLCRRGTPRTALEHLPIDIVEGELGDAAVLQQAVAGCSAVIHSAALIHIGWQQLDASRKVNVQGTQHILEACSQHAARLVYVSTVDTLPAASSPQQPIDERAIGGVPKTPCAYVISKREAEQVVQQAFEAGTVDGVVVHPGFMLGPFDWKPSSGRMFLQVTRAPLVAAPAGGCSVCDPRHVARACVNAIERGARGEHFILAGQNTPYRQLWQQMLEVAGRRRRVFRLGPLAIAAVRGLDLVHRWLPISEGDVNGAVLAMGNLWHYYDSSKAVRELDYDSSFSPETLREVWEWLRTHHQ